MKTLSIISIGNTKFKINKILPSKQKDLIFKVIALICKGEDNKIVEQFIHNQIQSGLVVSEQKVDSNTTFGLLISAVQKAISNLTEDDRETLFKEFLDAAEIIVDENNNTVIPCTYANLDLHLNSGFEIYKLVWEIAQANFFGSSTETK